ncbi:MAG: hypothetical protein K0V04_41655 [Deltaproteobacteria bacterium]|nr:hypothetical protein [Deltaproteobacteria bacterium]
MNETCIESTTSLRTTTSTMRLLALGMLLGGSNLACDTDRGADPLDRLDSPLEEGCFIELPEDDEVALWFSSGVVKDGEIDVNGPHWALKEGAPSGVDFSRWAVVGRGTYPELWFLNGAGDRVFKFSTGDGVAFRFSGEQYTIGANVDPVAEPQNVDDWSDRSSFAMAHSSMGYSLYFLDSNKTELYQYLLLDDGNFQSGGDLNTPGKSAMTPIGLFGSDSSIDGRQSTTIAGNFGVSQHDGTWSVFSGISGGFGVQRYTFEPIFREEERCLAVIGCILLDINYSGYFKDDGVRVPIEEFEFELYGNEYPTAGTSLAAAWVGGKQHVYWQGQTFNFDFDDPFGDDGFPYPSPL